MAGFKDQRSVKILKLRFNASSLKCLLPPIIFPLVPFSFSLLIFVLFTGIACPTKLFYSSSV